MITSIGMFGIPVGFAPLARFYKMPLLVLVGEITDKPVAIDKRVEVRPVLTLTATIDHRYADGWHIGQLIKPFRAYLEDPTDFEPDPATLPRTGDSVPGEAHREISDELEGAAELSPDEPAPTLGS
jgi:pyruvate dehydrogenase E2 component (dihydrolipoamide acetyltransferase)